MLLSLSRPEMCDPMRDLIRRARQSQPAAYIAPFAAFMVLLEIVRRVRIENSALPWWREFPEHWGYPLQVAVCLVLLAFWWRRYPALSSRGFGLGIAAGAFGIVVWLIPPVLHHFTGWGERIPWLEHFGFQERLEGFDPGVFAETAPPWVTVLVVVLRFVRLVLVVSLVEEIFWRGFLMRWITQPSDWNAVSLRACSVISVWATAGAFALAHAGPDLFVAFFYGALAGWVTIRTDNLWAVVVMHMTANLLLGAFIMATGWWGLW